MVTGQAEQRPVCVVSGRDRRVVQELMGAYDLVVAGSYGFDIWSPDTGTIGHEAARGFEELLPRVTASSDGVAVEPKRASVAAHHRPVAEPRRAEVDRVVDLLSPAEHETELKVTPGKIVVDIVPKLDCDAVLHLPAVLRLEGDGVVPIYAGDDFTDERAFEALVGRGTGAIVARLDEPEAAGRATAAEFALVSVEEIERFLDGLAR